MSVFVIIPAAGIGTRMAHATGGVSKQFLELKGLPILVHSLRAFLAVPSVTAIYVAVRDSEQARVTAMLAEHHLSAKVHVVTGGDNRQDSVANALAALPSTSARRHRPGPRRRPPPHRPRHHRTTPSQPSKSTAPPSSPPPPSTPSSRSSAPPTAPSSPPPSPASSSSTLKPRRARPSLSSAAPSPKPQPTSSPAPTNPRLLERANIPVFVVQGTSRNFKVTQPGDLEVAEFYLAG